MHKWQAQIQNGWKILNKFVLCMSVEVGHKSSMLDLWHVHIFAMYSNFILLSFQPCINGTRTMCWNQPWGCGCSYHVSTVLYPHGNQSWRSKFNNKNNNENLLCASVHQKRCSWRILVVSSFISFLLLRPVIKNR